MLRTIFLLLTLAISIFIVGCSSTAQAPVPDAYPLTTQQKMQAMHHWSVLADDVADQIHTTLKGRLVAQNWPIYVAPSGTTPFERAFQSLLVTHLVQRNMIVSNHPSGSVVLSFDIEAVRHSQRIMHVRDRIYIRLAPDVYVYRTGFDDQDRPGRVWRNDAVHRTWDRYHETGWYTLELPSTEVMVTSTLMYGEEYVMRDAAIYYVNESDAWHYQHPLAPEPPRSVIFQLTDR